MHVQSASSGVFVLQLFVREPEERLGVKGNIRLHSFFSNTDWEALERRQVAPPFKPTLVSAAAFTEGLNQFMVHWVRSDTEHRHRHN